MANLFPSLQQMYDDILVGTPLEEDSCVYAAFLDPVSSKYLSAEINEFYSETCVVSPYPDAQNVAAAVSVALKINKPDTCESISHSICHPRKIMLLQLTLIKMLLIKVQSPGLKVGMKQKYLDIFRVLKEANVDSKLICLLRCSDKLLAHMAAKSLVSLLHVQLTEESSLNGTWLAFCLKTLSTFPFSRWTAGCLWTLANLIRGILKDQGLCERGGLKKLFIPLDSVLESLYNGIVSQLDHASPDIPASIKATNDLTSFLDLLELLVISRIKMPLNCACQRMLFLNAACVLDLTILPVHDLIKKKSIMLLKKCICSEAGEDLIKSESPPLSVRDLHFNSDRLVLAGTILQFVNSGWLTQLSVDAKSSHFGSNHISPEVDICSVPDQVALRDVGLILLKALEIKIQDFTAQAQAQAQVHLENVMCPLLTFLKKHLKLSSCIHPYGHPCAWLSELFIEQDDDMLEAAKVLLTVYLKFQRFWRKEAFASDSSNDRTQDALMHRNGCNPHCIFLFLLRSIAYDATVLLDFLISSETCFLEYFVRYLKLLLEDWHHFVDISKCFDSMPLRDLSFSLGTLPCQENNSYQADTNLQETLSIPRFCTAALLTSSQNSALPCQDDNQSVNPNRHVCLTGSHNTSSLGALQRLVDYESSEESEMEWGGEECLVDMKQNPACSDVTLFVDVSVQAETLEQNVLPLDQKDLNISSPSCMVSPDNPVSGEGTLQKSVQCFQQLQELISRLHGRNLFPYNPGALLKLLSHIDANHVEYRSSPK